MEKKIYELIKKSEESWWYKGRSMIVKNSLEVFLKKKGPILDFGAGFGALYDTLKFYGPVDAFEVEIDAVHACMERGYVSVFTSISTLKHETTPYNLIGVFDVIEHVEDDKKLIKVFHNLLKEKGLLIVTVPAYQFLWSKHDVENQHFRRYTKTMLKTLFTQNGFVIEYASYWNFSLFPVAVSMRFFGLGGGEGLMPPKAINKLLTYIVLLESKLFPYVSLPWGTSVFIVARKKP